jgi:hypothetical protein
MNIDAVGGPNEPQAEHPHNEMEQLHPDGSLAIALKEMQLTLKELELALKLQAAAKSESEQEKSKKFSSSPLGVAIITGVVAIITGFLGLMGIAIANTLQSNASLTLEQKKFEFSSQQESQKNEATNKLERQKFESTLVLKAIETGDTTVAARNIQFLIDAGFLSDPGGNIGRYTKGPPNGKGPVLPRPGPVLSQSGATSRPDTTFQSKDICCITCNGITTCASVVKTECGECSAGTQ